MDVDRAPNTTTATYIVDPNFCPSDSQSLLTELLHQVMGVFNSLKEYRITENEEPKYQFRMERIRNVCDRVLKQFQVLRTHVVRVEKYGQGLTSDEKERRCREIVLKGHNPSSSPVDCMDDAAGDDTVSDQKTCGSFPELEKEKAELEVELANCNEELKIMIDKMRELIIDINSIQFYS